MRKLLLTLGFFVTFLTFNLNATILFVASCGEMTYTVDETYFDSKEEADKYYKELDKILCKDKQKITETEEKGESADKVDLNP